jgi:hypothetical protein
MWLTEDRFGAAAATTDGIQTSLGRGSGRAPVGRRAGDRAARRREGSSEVKPGRVNQPGPPLPVVGLVAGRADCGVPVASTPHSATG